MAANTLDNLSHKQEQAVLALLTSPTVAAAAKSCRVPERTVYRWLDKPDFTRAYRRCRREAFAQAVALTQRYAPVAINTLAKIMADDSAPYSSRVAAAIALLRFGRESLELDDLAARVDALEADRESEVASAA